MASYIPAFVIQKNNIVFVNGDGSVGSSELIPTPDNGGFIDNDAWAVPVNYGTYSGWTYLPYNPANSDENTAPTTASFAVVRISSTKSSDYFYVVGTAAQYATAAAGGAALPTNIPASMLVHSSQMLPECQVLDTPDPTSGLYVGTFGVPTLSGAEVLFAFGNFNGTALTALSSNGYVNAASLIVAMNSAWGAAVGGTFTKTADNLTIILTQSAGSSTDIFCGNIIAINKSL